MNLIVHRADRNATIEVIQAYLHDAITAFAFDEKLSEIASRTTDRTVKWVRAQLWGCYDDCEDHRVVGDRQAWDMIQRLLLLLQSDASVVVDVGPARWTARQAVAALGLLVFGWTVWQTGWGKHLLIANLPLGLVSMGLSWWRQRADRRRETEQAALAPFGSLTQLRSIRRSVKGFAKLRYPEWLADRRIRSPLADFGLWLQFSAFWLMFSPVPLFFQAWPERTTGWRVVTGSP